MELTNVTTQKYKRAKRACVTAVIQPYIFLFDHKFRYRGYQTCQKFCTIFRVLQGFFTPRLQADSEYPKYVNILLIISSLLVQAALSLNEEMGTLLVLPMIWNQAKNYKTTLATVVFYIPVFNTLTTLSSTLF